MSDVTESPSSPLSPAADSIQARLLADHPTLTQHRGCECLATLSRAVLWHQAARAAIDAGFGSIAEELPNLYLNIEAACGHLGLDSLVILPQSERIQ